MKIDFEVTLDDVMEFNYFASKHAVGLQNNRQKTKAFVFPFAGILIILGIVVICTGDTSNGLIGLILGLLLLCWYLYLVSDRRIRSRIKRIVTKTYTKTPNDLICRHTIVVSEDGVTDITDMEESSTRWAAIEELVVTEKQLLLMYSAGIKGYIIPKSAFPNDASMKQFIQETEGYLNKKIEVYEGSL